MKLKQVFWTMDAVTMAIIRDKVHYDLSNMSNFFACNK